MRFRVLGPVEIESQDGQVYALPRRQQRCLLAVLLLEPGHVVSLDRLCRLLWDDQPQQARRSVHTHVARIRAALARTRTADTCHDDQDVELVSYGNGYLLRVDPETVDAHRFRVLLRRATNATDLREREHLLGKALALWRGPALHNAATSETLRQQLCADLDEQRLQALEAWLATGVDLGRHLERLPELARISNEHRGRERLVELHMLALHRSGRTADALRAYREARAYLVDELGVEPGLTLQGLHLAVLRGDPVSTAAQPATLPHAASAPVVPVPAQLPADVPAFTGRAAELAQLDTILLAGQDRAEPRPTVLISALSGTAGVGKTALALRWAHRVTHQFPDGQLHVDLRGYDPDQPITSADVLARFLTALGVSGPDIPLDLTERAARFRTQVAGRRILVVLDNASTVAQVRPLLPGTPSCAVVVTSRDRLAGLVARDGAHRLDVDLLPADDAIALLRALIGPRVDADPDAAAALAEQCARLPLALRVAAELTATRSGSTLADLVDELGDQQRRLDLLDVGGDPHAAVAAVFSWSVRHLPASAARTFERLGLHPGPDFDVYAAAALAGTDRGHAARTMGLLARAHLIHVTTSGRYGMHDLLHAYARSRATAQSTNGETRNAQGRLFDYYAATAAAAMDRLHPSEAYRRPQVALATTPTPDLPDLESASAWLDAELPNLVAMAAYTAQHGWPEHAVRLSRTLFRYLYAGHYNEAVAIHTHARGAARKAGDLSGEANASLYLGTVHLQNGRYGLAAEHLQQAVALFRRADDPAGGARALANIGTIEMKLGRYRSAVRHLEEALAPLQAGSDRLNEAGTRTLLGAVLLRLGDHASAADQIQLALNLYRQAGSQIGEAFALTNLGDVEQQLGHLAPAGDHLHQALTLCRQLGIRVGEAMALDSLGTLHTRRGEPDVASAHHEQALAICRDLGDRDEESTALNGIGEANQAAGRPSEAVTHHTAALTLATNTGVRDQQARALSGLGQAHHALGNCTLARQNYERALALYTALESPDADELRARLATFDQPST